MPTPTKTRIDPRITTARRVEVVPIGDLAQWDRNPHTGDDAALQESIRRFGQVTPIVRAPDGWIIAGNTTLRAMIAEEFTHAAVVTLDAPEAEQIAFGLASNRIGTLGQDDNAMILALLQEIEVLDGTGFTVDDMADLTALQEEITRADRDLPPSAINPDTGTANNEPSMGGYLDGYSGHTVRSIVLDLELPLFSYVIEHAETLRHEFGVDTNSALVVALIAEKTGTTPPVIPAES